MQWEWTYEPNAPLCVVRIDGEILHWQQKGAPAQRRQPIHVQQTAADFREFGPLWQIPDDIEEALAERVGAAEKPWKGWPTPGVDEMIAYVNRGDMVSLRFMRTQGARLDGRDHSGYDPFYRAVRTGRREMALWILEQGFPANRYYHHHVTALMVAAEEREREVIATLLARGADPTARDDWGESALSRAAQYEGAPLSIVQLLIDAGADDLTGALVQAVYYNNRRIVDYLVRAGAPINGGDAYGWSPLEAAFRRSGDHPGMVRTLIGIGVDMRQPFSDGRTMVHAAAERAWGKIMQVGLDAGIPVDSRIPDTGFTPLMVAMRNGKNLAAVKALIAAGADVNARTTESCDEQTPLMILARSGDFWDMAETVINAGADIELTDRTGRTALAYAVEYNARMVARLLLEKGANPNTRAEPAIERSEQFTILHRAASNNNVTMVRLLLEHGADPNTAETEEGRTPLHYAQDDRVRNLLREASA